MIISYYALSAHHHRAHYDYDRAERHCLARPALHSNRQHEMEGKARRKPDDPNRSWAGDDERSLHFKNRGRLLNTTTACFSLSARPVQEPCSSLMCQPQELGRAVRIPHLAYAQMPDDTRTHSPVARFRHRKSGRTVRARHQNIIFRPMY